MLKFIDLSESIIHLKDEVMDLLLEELDDGVALSDCCITLVDLILRVKNGFIFLCDDLLLFCDHCLERFYLCDLSVSMPVVTLSGAGQLADTAA
jgi:hypothetical protein